MAKLQTDTDVLLMATYYIIGVAFQLQPLNCKCISFFTLD